MVLFSHANTALQMSVSGAGAVLLSESQHRLIRSSSSFFTLKLITMASPLYSSHASVSRIHDMLCEDYIKLSCAIYVAGISVALLMLFTVPSRSTTTSSVGRGEDDINGGIRVNVATRNLEDIYIGSVERQTHWTAFHNMDNSVVLFLEQTLAARNVHDPHSHTQYFSRDGQLLNSNMAWDYVSRHVNYVTVHLSTALGRPIYI
ncbi:uncharacterized protein LOC126664877 [Mercurialis annua]|uniref:uncharacterized protein LOC126664877 n=1 Tax=Mercurialis annua TaxID=3986 RepID=UPI00215F227F|nr:uncharacterized protein LOC126664877 [Mercurialis annua]